MSCSIHWQWPHDQDDCPFCATTTNHNMAVDLEGKPLPFTPEQVHQISMNMVNKGQLIASIWRVGNDLAVRVEGPPSQELVDILQQALDGYKRTLKGM